MHKDEIITIKRVTKTDDLSAILSSIQNTDWLEESEIDRDEYSLESLTNFVSNESRVLIVAYYQGVFAGMSSCYVLVRSTGQRWLYIDEVDVGTDYLRKGIAKSMLAYILNLSKDLLLDEVWVGTESDNIPADCLYRSCKPDEIGTFLGYTWCL